MPSEVSNTSSPSQTTSNDLEGARPSADRVYQTLTVAAILLVLGSLWLF